MAKGYTAASSQTHVATAAPLSALPATLFCRFRTSSTTGTNRTCVALDTAAGSARLQIGITSTDTPNATAANSAGTTAGAGLATTVGANEWHTLAGVFRSSTSRDCYLDGVIGTINTTSIAFTTPDRVRLGARVASSVEGNYHDGRLCDVAVWNVALNDAENAALADGASPLHVRPSALVFYAPMWETSSAVLDIVGGVSLAAVNSPTDQDGPAVAGVISVGSPVQAGAAGPTISSTSDTNTLIDESSFVITGTGMTSATAVTFKQTNRPNFDATAFITANDATSVTLTGLDVQDMSMAYGAATVSVTTAGGTSADFAITIAPQAAHTHITLASTDAGVEWLGLTSADGDQRVSATTTTKGGTFAFVGTDGNYTITYAGTAPTNDSVYWAEFDDSADQWYESTVAINPAAGGSSASILNLMQHRDRKHLRQR